MASGGVTCPITTAMTISTPKWRRSTSKARRVGRMMGSSTGMSGSRIMPAMIARISIARMRMY